MKIALDAMGGDLAPRSPVQGTLKFLKESSSDVEVILVGDNNILNQELGRSIPNGIRIHHSSQVVSMHDHGSKVIKSKPDSSIVQGINLVKGWGRRRICKRWSYRSNYGFFYSNTRTY